MGEISSVGCEWTGTQEVLESQVSRGRDPGRKLQLCHVKGGGRDEMVISVGGVKRTRYYRRIIQSEKNGEGKYQLLCANCNWMKRAQLGL